MKAQYDIAPRQRDIAPYPAIAPHSFTSANAMPNGSDKMLQLYTFSRAISVTSAPIFTC